MINLILGESLTFITSNSDEESKIKIYFILYQCIYFKII